MEEVEQVGLQEPIVIGGRTHFVESTGRLVRIGDYSNVSELEFVRCNLSGLNMSSGRYSHTKFVECTLDGADLSFSHLDGAIFEHCSMKGCSINVSNLDKAVFYDCNLEGAAFANSSFVYGRFVVSSLVETWFNKCHFEMTNFNQVEMLCCNFEGVIMRHVYFDRAISRGFVKISESTLYNVQLTQSRMVLKARDVEAQCLVVAYSDLHRTQCVDTVISESAFSYVIFDDCDLRNLDVFQSEFDHCSHFGGKMEDVCFDETKFSDGFSSIVPEVSVWSLVTQEGAGILAVNEEDDKEEE